MTNTELVGEDELMLTKTQIGRIQKAIAQGKGSDIKISKTQIRHVVKEGGNLFSSLMSTGMKLLPMVSKFAPKIAAPLATGAISALGSFGIDEIFGSGQTGGFLISQNKIDQLIAYKHLLTKKQKEQILEALQSGGQLILQPTKAQTGGFLGTLLASIGVPLLLNALSSGSGLRNRPKVSGAGMQNRPYFLPYQSPPIHGSWDDQIGTGMKKKKRRTKKKTGKGLLFGKNSPFDPLPIIGDIF